MARYEHGDDIQERLEREFDWVLNKNFEEGEGIGVRYDGVQFIGTLRNPLATDQESGFSGERIDQENNAEEE